MTEAGIVGLQLAEIAAAIIAVVSVTALIVVIAGGILIVRRAWK